MTYKQIEAAREARLWVVQIVVPTLVVIGTALAIPEVRTAVADKAKSVSRSLKKKFGKD